MTITSEMVISGFISKIVNEIVDVPLNPIKNAIKNADKNRKAKNQNIETRIYQVIIDAIKEFTKKDYKGQEVLYDAAESIIKGFKSNKNSNPEAVRAGLKMLVLQVTSDTCEDFLGILCYEICKEGNRDLAIEVIIFQQEQTNGYIQKEFRRSYLNYEEINQKLDYLIKELVKKKVYAAEHYNENYIENRSKKYADKWNENVFLNNFNKRDENAGVNIKLSELYLEKHLPHYIWKTNVKLRYDLKDLLGEYIVNRDDKKMLLILGQPGIGKSTLITWMMANLAEKKEDIFVYQFVSDLKDVNWQEEDILEKIFIVLRLRDEELKNKVLILDGFDEVSISGNRERILNKLHQELKMMNFLDNFSLIITCRENYVDQSNLENIDYITLQAWNEDQIKSFCEVYGKENTKEESEKVNNKISEIKINKIIEKKEIFGIPLILYMVLALDVAIEKSSSIVDIYDQIFLSNGGSIYDRCYDVEHRINAPEIKIHIHHISQKIAFWMFENNADKAIISQEKFEEICVNEMRESDKKGEDIQSDTLIGNFFQIKHCEGKGTDELQFVHRTIYEYFVATYFYESLYKLKSKEEVAGKLGELLKDGRLSKQILEFIKCKSDKMQGEFFLDVIREVFDLMLQSGMTYYFTKGQKKPLLDILVREMNIFSNMLEMIHLWYDKMESVDKKIEVYLRYNHHLGLNLVGIHLNRAHLDRADLRGAHLDGADLRGACLDGADLSGAHLDGANLSGAYLNAAYLDETSLNGADLSGVLFYGANLFKANLRDADLRKAKLSSANLDGAELNGANLNGIEINEKQADVLCEKYNINDSRIYIFGKDEYINWKEYYIRKQKKEI